MRGGRCHFHTCFATTAKLIRESVLSALAMPERRTGHVACRKSGVGCKCLGRIE
jgi:hypothetical protein